MALSEREQGSNPGPSLPEAGSPENLPAKGLPVITKRQKFQPVEIFSNARRIVRPVENYFHRVHNRGNREGLEAALAIDGFTVPFIPIAHSLITAAIYAGANITDPRLTAAVTVAIIGVQIPRSIKKDAEALRKKHFDASTVGTIMYPFVGHPVATAIAEQGANLFFIGTVSPAALIMGATGDFNIYPASIAAAGIMMPAWYAFVNSAIARGELDQVLNSLRQKQEAFIGEIKHKIKR